jgi:hypothetical protein
MNIAFTICSNNYLAQAKTVADSFIKYNEDFIFFIGLIDKKDASIDYSFFSPHRIIEIEELSIKGFEELYLKYNIIELNTASKPFFFNYFFEKCSAQKIIYLDPDIMVYNSFNQVCRDLDNVSIIITPHSLTPIELDGYQPDENLFLNHGIYNLGFIALSNTSETFRFLQWWSERLREKGYIKLEEGMFTDQLYINLVPLFFKNVKIEDDKGYNMAFWNLHERLLSKVGNKYLVNAKYNLLFFHFSRYSPSRKDVITVLKTGQYRYTFDTRNDLIGLFNEYDAILINNKYFEFSNLRCYYSMLREQYLQRKKKEWIFSSKQRASLYFIKKFTPQLIKKTIRQALYFQHIK